MTEQQIERGAIAEVTVTHKEGPRYHYEGDRFRVEEYVSAAESDNGVAYYEGSSHEGIYDVTVDADKVRLFMAAEAVAARKPPSTEAILSELGMEVANLRGDGFETDSADRTSTGFYIEGTTSDDLRFGFYLTVSDIAEVVE